MCQFVGRTRWFVTCWWEGSRDFRKGDQFWSFTRVLGFSRCATNPFLGILNLLFLREVGFLGVDVDLEGVRVRIVLFWSSP